MIVFARFVESVAAEGSTSAIELSFKVSTIRVSPRGGGK
jgi:hypothetical protein